MAPAAASYTERYAHYEAPTVRRGRRVLRPRSSARRLLALFLTATLAGTVALGYAAVLDPTTATVGLAASCAGLLLVTWGVFASTAPVRVSIDDGVLEVVDRHGRHRFDLTTTHTPIEMVGRPGQRGWEVRLGRGAEPPLVLTARSVRPEQLVEMLRGWRPGL